MYIYTMQVMPGSKAKPDGDTSVQYRVKRTHTSPAPGHQSRTDVIRSDVGYTEATAMIKRFNDKELEARATRKQEASRPRTKA